MVLNKLAGFASLIQAGVAAFLLVYEQRTEMDDRLEVTVLVVVLVVSGVAGLRLMFLEAGRSG